MTKFGQEVTFQVAGARPQAPLYAQLHAKQIGALVASPIAIAPLSYAQEMAGLNGRVSRILVQPAPGRRGPGARRARRRSPAAG